jgi:Putative Actinobacterial Holin-X, holin superfamily III
MPTGFAFLIMGAAWLVAAGLLFMTGRNELKSVDPVPQTKAELKEDVEWARQQRT